MSRFPELGNDAYLTWESGGTFHEGDGPNAEDLRDANMLMWNKMAVSASVPVNADGRMVPYDSFGKNSYENIMKETYRTLAIRLLEKLIVTNPEAKPEKDTPNDGKKGSGQSDPERKSINGKFTENDLKAAIDLIKATLPSYYNSIKEKYKLMVYGNSVDHRKESGWALGDGPKDTINVNMDYTTAFLVFTGTTAQFLAVVILHESLHLHYYDNRKIFEPSATQAMGEASVRYWVEVWAIANGLPETLPNIRQGPSSDGRIEPDFKQIYMDVVYRDNYPEEPYIKRRK